MYEFKDIKYSEGWDQPNFVGVAMTFTIVETKPRKNYLEEYFDFICEASDSRQPIRMCWCPQCAEDRKKHGIRKSRETKEFRYIYS